MFSKKMQEALNGQINAELWSAYLYLSMAMDAEAKGYKGIANWFRVQFREEQEHAEKIMDYILSRGGQVTLAPIAAVQTHWESVLGLFEDTLRHEKEVTAMIDALYKAALAEEDFATVSMLGWFVDEQVEEEESAGEIVDRIRRCGENPVALEMLNKELGERK